jgi:hypothetical protein
VEEVMHPPKSEALRALYWRSEILQVMFWLKGEGFGDQVDATLLERFLGVDSHIGVQYLDRLVTEGYVERIGECSADCWCHNSPDEAEACARDRAMKEELHDHQH